MSAAYRSAYDHIVGVKLAETEEVRSQLAPIMPTVRGIVGRRIARIVAGAIGVSGALAMVMFAAVTENRDPTVTYALVFSALAVVLTWIFGRTVASIVQRLRKTGSVRLALSGELDADLAKIDATDPRAELRAIEERAGRLEKASIALPIAAVALLAPLLSHLVFLEVFSGDTFSSFAEWIRISLVVVGHAHIALCILGVLFARKVFTMSTDVLAAMRIHREWAKIWLITIGISCLPGIILFLVPPILVAITGLVFIPFLFTFMYRAVLAERNAFAFADSAAQLRVADPGAIAPHEFLAKEEQREARRDDEDADGDADDGAEREALLLAAHRIGDDGARR